MYEQEGTYCKNGLKCRWAVQGSKKILKCATTAVASLATFTVLKNSSHIWQQEDYGLNLKSYYSCWGEERDELYKEKKVIQ